MKRHDFRFLAECSYTDFIGFIRSHTVGDFDRALNTILNEVREEIVTAKLNADIFNESYIEQCEVVEKKLTLIQNCRNLAVKYPLWEGDLKEQLTNDFEACTLKKKTRVKKPVKYGLKDTITQESPYKILEDQLIKERMKLIASSLAIPTSMISDGWPSEQNFVSETQDSNRQPVSKLDNVESVQCTCGARHTSFPNSHSYWCKIKSWQWK